MVAKLKAQPMSNRKSASRNLPATKRKKFYDKGKNNGRKANDMARPLKKAKNRGLSLGDELEEEIYNEEGEEEEAQEVSDRSSGEENEYGLDAEAEVLFPTLKAENSERDLHFDENSDGVQNNIQSLLYADRGEEMEALDREYKELQAQEVEMLRNLKGRSDEEVLKGQAVRSQKALWDKALEVRILLQKPFSSANQLPMGETKLHMGESDKIVENAFAKLSASTSKTLSCLQQTVEALMNQNDSIDKDFDDDASHQQSEKYIATEFSDDLDAIWQRSSDLYSSFVPFRNSTVDRWQRKTQLSSGAAASKSKLRAFNHSISQQIETHMRDFSRVLQRMCLKRSTVEVIGMPSAGKDSDNATADDSTLEEGSKDFSGDPELIDDTEFYQELLREFLEYSDPSSLGTMYAVRKLHSKNRKIVDRRASKGRKIRYSVHDKIVNFMAPMPMNIPPMAEKLFSHGLFRGPTLSITS